MSHFLPKRFPSLLPAPVNAMITSVLYLYCKHYSAIKMCSALTPSMCCTQTAPVFRSQIMRGVILPVWLPVIWTLTDPKGSRLIYSKGGDPTLHRNKLLPSCGLHSFSSNFLQVPQSLIAFLICLCCPFQNTAASPLTTLESVLLVRLCIPLQTSPLTQWASLMNLAVTGSLWLKIWMFCVP